MWRGGDKSETIFVKMTGNSYKENLHLDVQCIALGRKHAVYISGVYPLIILVCYINNSYNLYKEKY